MRSAILAAFLLAGLLPGHGWSQPPKPPHAVVGPGRMGPGAAAALVQRYCVKNENRSLVFTAGLWRTVTLVAGYRGTRQPPPSVLVQPARE
jgi:putative SOS response-associated peptidase YedK